MDLKQFCSNDPTRKNELGEPWSFGGCSFASNGHVMVRVNRRDDVPERPEAPNAKAERLFTAYFNFGGPFTPLGVLALPDAPRVSCKDCEGRGTVHACPSCACACPGCNGKGYHLDDSTLSVGLRGASFDGKYVRALIALPELRLPIAANNEMDAMPFTFDGGDGLLMPYRGRRSVHVQEIEQPA